MLKVYFLLVLCVLFWSGNFVVGRYFNESIQPLELATFRWIFVILFLTPTIFFIDLKKIFFIVKKRFLILSVLSIISVTLFNTFVYTALQSTTATNALLINSSVPILILLFSFIILKIPLSKIQVFGVFLSTIGVIFLILKGDLNSLKSLDFHDGDFWIIASSLSWAFYSVILRFKPKELTNFELFFITVILGFLYLLPLYFIQGYSIEKEIKVLQNNWMLFIYVSFFASILSYSFWNFGISKIGANKVGQFTHLMPIFGSILAFVFLGERLEVYHIIGAIFIALGIYLSLFLTKKQ